jgi:hypothetical protein
VNKRKYDIIYIQLKPEDDDGSVLFSIVNSFELLCNGGILLIVTEELNRNDFIRVCDSFIQVNSNLILSNVYMMNQIAITKR